MSGGKRERTKGFAQGVITTLLVLMLGVTAFAAAQYKTIEIVYNDIKLYVDGKLVVPMDGAGKPIQPFLYNGTVYLPARALSNALTNNTKEVSWDSKNQSIYIGAVPAVTRNETAAETSTPAADTGDAAPEWYFNMLELPLPAANPDSPRPELVPRMLPGERAVGFESIEKISGNAEHNTKKYNPEEPGIYNNYVRSPEGEKKASATYLLNSKYSRLRGTFGSSDYMLPKAAEPIPNENETKKNELKYVLNFYSIDKNGGEKKIKSIAATFGRDNYYSSPVEVNLEGVDQLKIEMEHISGIEESPVALYRVILIVK